MKEINKSESRHKDGNVNSEVRNKVFIGVKLSFYDVLYVRNLKIKLIILYVVVNNV